MKNIALMTWYENENYGTSLQAYALQQYLGKYGKCKIIRYKTPIIHAKPSFFFRKNTRKRYWNKLGDKLILATNNSILNRYSHNAEKYSEFVADNLLFTNPLTADELCTLNKEFDYFVCGSDQIWNPTRLDIQYFLGFADQGKKKIAYAPSFGVADLTSFKEKADILEALKKFDHISVRDESGRKIIKENLGFEPKVCLDPTLLVELDFWRNRYIHNTVHTRKYLLCYFLTPQKRYWDYVKKISAELNLEVKLIPYNIRDYLNTNSIKEPFGTTEFLQYFSNASYICTDSFHGTIFSMIFGIPFVVMKRFSDASIYSQNSRVYSLLQMTDQMFRLEPSENDIKECYSIDLSKIERLLSIQRKNSQKYLDTAFEYEENR